MTSDLATRKSDAAKKDTVVTTEKVMQPEKQVIWPLKKLMQPKQAGWFDFVGGNETIQQTNGTKHDFWLQDLLLCAHKTFFVHRTGTKKGWYNQKKTKIRSLQ